MAEPLLSASAERRGVGLSAKLLFLTLIFVMLAEVLIFVPSVANFRVNWLNDRLTAAQLAALAAEAVPGGVVPEALRVELLRTAQVRAVALKRSRERRLVLADGNAEIDETFDFRASARSQGFVKVVTDAKGRIRGAAIVGAHAGELVQMWSLAISQGLNIKAMTQWISPYPTLSEINRRVAFGYYATAAASPLVRKLVGWLARV